MLTQRVKTYLARLDEQRPAIVSTERKIERLVGDVPMVGIIDRIDAVENTTRISDYKSGPYKDFNTYKYGNQIHLYAHMVGEEDGVTPHWDASPIPIVRSIWRSIRSGLLMSWTSSKSLGIRSTRTS